MNKGIFLLCVFFVMCFSGCVKSKNNTGIENSSLYLDDSVIGQCSGDMGCLYKAWIFPHRNKDGYVKFQNDIQRQDACAAVGDGFKRFCVGSSGLLNVKNVKSGSEYYCYSSSGSLIGSLSVTMYKGSELGFVYDAQEYIDYRAQREREFNELQMTNGPSGWVFTDEGKFRFLRIGTLERRHVVELRKSSNDKNGVLVDDVRRLGFDGVTVQVETNSGEKYSINTGRVLHVTSEYVSTYGITLDGGFPLVIVDEKTGQPYTRVFPNFDKIVSMEMDARDAWQDLSGGRLTTGINIDGMMSDYVKKLKIKANELYKSAEKSELLKILPKDSLTPQLSDYLKYRLKSMSTEEGYCRGNAIKGITSLETIMQCKQAQKELGLVVEKGYSLHTDITPLAAIIVIEKIMKDVQ